MNMRFAELGIIIVHFWLSINHAATVTRPLQSPVLTSAASGACSITAVHTLAGHTKQTVFSYGRALSPATIASLSLAPLLGVRAWGFELL